MAIIGKTVNEDFVSLLYAVIQIYQKVIFIKLIENYQKVSNITYFEIVENFFMCLYVHIAL